MAEAVLWMLFAAGLLVALAPAIVYGLLVLFSPQTIASTAEERTYLSASNATEHRPFDSTLQEPASLSLSVIVPAYNERDRLGIMVDEAMEHLVKPATAKRYDKGVEILIVDDGSSDGTTEVAVEIAQRWAKRLEGEAKKSGVEIRVVTLTRNRGKGGAVRHGVLFARGERILFADADGASRFADLDLLDTQMDKLLATKPAKEVENGSSNGNASSAVAGHAIAVGSRAHMVNTEAVVKRSFLRNLLMHGFHLFLRTLGVSGIRDTQCGFKLFSRASALSLFPRMHLHRWSFDVELLLLASLMTPPIPVAEVPIAWHEVDGSKISVAWDGLGMARDLLVLRGNLALGRWALPQAKGQAVRSNGSVNGKAPWVR